MNNEISDRVAAGQSAQTALDNETMRAISAESSIQSDLDAYKLFNNAALAEEHAHHTAAEGVLTSDLADEISNRVSAVSAEEASRIAGDAQLSATFSSALSIETARATSAEGVLQSNIDTEKFRIDAILIGASASADNFAEIVSLINSVDTTNDQVFAGYVLSNDAALSTETARATAAESALSATFSSALSAETARATAAELVLTTDLSSEVSRATAAESALSATFSSALSAETDRATAAELVLTTDFANIYSKKVIVIGTPNGVLTTFTLASAVRIGSEMIYVNGLLMEEGEDYTTIVTSGKVSGVEFLYTPSTEMKVRAYGVCGI